MAQRLLKIPTAARTRISLEDAENREPKDPDIIDLTPPVEQPVVDDGVGTGAPGAEPEPTPAGDAPTVPAGDGDVGVTPPAAGETPTDEPGGNDVPPAEPDVPPVEPPTEPPSTPPADAVPPAEPPADVVPPAEPNPTEPAANTEPVPGSEPSPFDAPAGDAAPSDVPPVTGSAPVEPDGTPAGEPATPADAASSATSVANEPGTEPTPEPAPDDEPAPEPMTSAWVDGVSLDAEEVKQHLEDSAAEVMDADNTVDELREAAVALEELHAAVSESLAEENPVVSETTVNLVNIEAEKALEKIGETHDIKSMESVSAPIDRLRISLEAISDKVKEIWEAIKAAIAKAWEAVKKFFKNIFDAAERTKENLTKLKNNLDGVQGEPKEVTLENEAVFKAVAIGNKVDWSEYVGKLETMGTKLASYLNNAPKAMQQVLAETGNTLVKAIKEDREGRDEKAIVLFSNVTLGYSDLCAKFVDQIVPGAKSKLMGEGTEITSGPLPGGYEVSVQSFRKDADFEKPVALSLATDILLGRNVYFGRVEVEGKELKVMSKDEMVSAVDAALAIMDAVFDGRDAVSSLEKATDTMRRDAEYAIRQVDNSWITSQGNRNLVANIMGYGSHMVRFNGEVLGMATSICSGAAKAVATSMSQYKLGALVEGKSTKVNPNEPAPEGAVKLPAPAAA